MPIAAGAEMNINQRSITASLNYKYIPTFRTSPELGSRELEGVVLLIGWLTDIRAIAQFDLFEKPTSSTVSVTAVA